MHHRCYPTHQLLYGAGLSARRKRTRERRRRQHAAAPPRASARTEELYTVATVKRLAYSRRQAAEALGLSISTIDRHVVPAIDTIKTPWRQRLIPVAELERFLREHRDHARPATTRRRAGRPPSLPKTIVERVRLEHMQGRSLGEIALGLTADRIPTAHGGRRWWPSTVRALLLRESTPDP
jgi:hypothetical protein